MDFENVRNSSGFSLENEILTQENCGADFPSTFYISRLIILTLCGFGLIGNILCLIVMTRKALQSSFIYILIGLAISDTMLLVYSATLALADLQLIKLHMDFYTSWYFVLWDWISTTGIKFYTVGISVERCLAVYHPLRLKAWLTSARAKLWAVAIFGLDLAIGVFSYFYHAHDTWAYYLFHTITIHILPFATVLFLNILIFIQIRKGNKIRKELSEVEADEMVSITWMLLAVVVVFGLSYSFITIERLYTLFGSYDDCSNTTQTVVHILHRIFSVFNSSVNFIIYSWLGKPFRAEFIKLCYSCSKTKGVGPPMYSPACTTTDADPDAYTTV